MVFYDRYFINPAEEVARLTDFCGLPRPVQARALAAAVRDDLRHQRSDVAALLACDRISRESKLLYLGLRGLESAGEEFGPREAGSGNSVVELLRMLEDSPQHQLLAGLQSRLNRTELAFANLHAEIWRDTKANHPWAYRFYRKVLRPFHIARFRATHKDFR